MALVAAPPREDLDDMAGVAQLERRRMHSPLHAPQLAHREALGLVVDEQLHEVAAPSPPPGIFEADHHLARLGDGQALLADGRSAVVVHAGTYPGDGWITGLTNLTGLAPYGAGDGAFDTPISP